MLRKLPQNPFQNYKNNKIEIDTAINDVLNSGWYILGEKGKLFEKSFSKYFQNYYCIGVANGTDAINLSLRAIGIKPGDKVITTTHSANATVSAIEWMGANPILVDIDSDSFNLDPNKVELTIKSLGVKNIKAIILVHLYGNPADIESYLTISKKYDIPIIEDCAQAHGAKYSGKKVGLFGLCGTFSFYPTKNLGALGDAGAIITEDKVIFNKLKSLQQYGWTDRYISSDIGYNSRLDEIQAAVLNVKLQYLDKWNNRRAEIANIYNSKLIDLELKIPYANKKSSHVFHQYVIKTKKRDQLQSHLRKYGINTSVLYPVPIHLQPAYLGRLIKGSGGFKNSEKITNQILCLPIFPELKNIDIEYIADKVIEFFK